VSVATNATELQNGIMKWDFSQYFHSDFWAAFFTRSRSVHRYFAKALRIARSAFRGFQADECYAKASALTFYSLLSVVPVLAVAFGIAKGFGFQQHLEAELSQKFVEQREVLDKLIEFAYKAIQNAEGGLLAGVGLIILLWTALKLFSNIESSFNAIWKVKKPRSFARSVSDYLAMMLFCPIFFFASSSLSVHVITKITDFSKSTNIWDQVSPLVYLTLHIFPLVLAWLLFTALYAIMPNTRVPLKYAFLAGVCAGTAYQVVQALYIKFQIGLASYSAVYGSFAALPLFLIWLNTSWLIALAGAEIAYHAENDPLYLESEHSQRRADARILALLIMNRCAKAFCSGAAPSSIYDLSHYTGGAISATKHILQQLIDAGLLVEVNWKSNSGDHFLPARDLKMITLKAVCDAVNTARQDSYLLVYNDEVKGYEQALAAMDTFVEDSTLNHSIVGNLTRPDSGKINE